MLRILLAFVLFAHGLIHLLGFVHAWKLADLPGFTGKTLVSVAENLVRPIGLLWLVAGSLFVVSSAMFAFKKDTWWMVAAPALVLSQALIVLYWADARFGTVANVIALVAIVVAGAEWRVQRDAHRAVQTLLAENLPVAGRAVVTRDDLAPLPPLVQKWLERSGVVGRPRPHVVHLRQNGAMRTTPTGRWMPFTAEQFFTVEKPGFVWIADVAMAPGVHLSGVDTYRGGHGAMQIKALSLVPVVDSRGPTIDQGTLLRYLGEICWFPAAALHPYIRWEQLDSTTARATMTYGDVSASMDLTFTADGDLARSQADRYYDRKDGATLERWQIDAKAWDVRDGVRIPVDMDVTWRLKEGDFTWLRLEIAALEAD